MNWEQRVEVDARRDDEFKNLIDTLFLDNVKKEVMEDRSKEIHITDLVNPCPRYVWFSKMYPEIRNDRTDDKGWMRVWSGKKLHETPISLDGHEFELMWEFADDPYGKIVGSVDEIVDDKVIDKKFYGYLPEEAYPHHVKQVLYYMAILRKMGRKVRYGMIYYIERKNFDTRLFVFEVDDEMLEEAFEEMIGRAMYLREHLVSGKIPDGDKGGWMCKYCPFRIECLDYEEFGGD